MHTRRISSSKQFCTSLSNLLVLTDTNQRMACDARGQPATMTAKLHEVVTSAQPAAQDLLAGLTSMHIGLQMWQHVLASCFTEEVGSQRHSVIQGLCLQIQLLKSSTMGLIDQR